MSAEPRVTFEGELVALDGAGGAGQTGGGRRYRKVAYVVGPSRNTRKLRMALWSAQRKCWSSVRAIDMDRIIGAAPADWPQTRAARRALDTREPY